MFGPLSPSTVIFCLILIAKIIGIGLSQARRNYDDTGLPCFLIVFLSCCCPLATVFLRSCLQLSLWPCLLCGPSVAPLAVMAGTCPSNVIWKSWLVYSFVIVIIVPAECHHRCHRVGGFSIFVPLLLAYWKGFSSQAVWITSSLSLCSRNRLIFQFCSLSCWCCSCSSFCVPPASTRTCTSPIPNEDTKTVLPCPCPA